ncbi:IpaB/EvcA family protein [Weissella viridescens]|uniref:IpaB/EvcA family protein n=1 Tax=Weissella viridescens TaxID=1629 RepID=UPI00092E3F01|nr:IpaB/EvcA family protein [Weissella viridescens]
MQFSADTLKLLDQVNQLYPGSIVLHGSGDASGIINHEQVTTDVLGERLAIQVTDATAPDFTATHELLHMMLGLGGFPQVFFQLKVADNDDLTEQMIVMSTYLYRPALHAIIYKEQKQHGLITNDVLNGYVKGVEAELTPETSDDEQSQAALRIMLLLDAQVLFSVLDNDQIKAKQTELMDLYPVAWAAASEILAAMQPEKITNALGLHRAVVAAFTTFDEQMAKMQLPLLNAKEFATLTPVLSERQLRLTVNQIFNIKHVDLLDETTNQTAYIGVTKQDGQNSFAISAPEEETQRAEFFKELYQLSVSELFDQTEQPYTLRD